MKIAIYAQQLLEKALQAAKNLEPISLCGMFDAGVDYLFSLSVPYFSSELPKDIRVIAVDLSGVTSRESTQSELGFALAAELSDVAFEKTYLGLTKIIRAQAEQARILFDIYLGQDAPIDPEFFLFLNRLRNLLGWRFSYVLFMNTKNVFGASSQPVFDKVIKRNLVPILPRSPSDSLIIVNNYEERYGKNITETQRKRIVELSGGNSGLIKAMTLQALEDAKWDYPDMLDERLFFRLKGIVEDVPEPMRSLLVSLKKTQENSSQIVALVRFGYLFEERGNMRIFSPLIPSFIAKHIKETPHSEKIDRFRVDETILRLTLSQRKLLAHFEQHPGEIISKDTIAQILWGEDWADRYSDWAIDQLLSTLRERLASMKYKGKIVTKKGEGIVFLPKQL